MITVDVLAFLGLIAAALIVGAALAFHVYGCNTKIDDRITRFHRDTAINDAADMAETNRDA